MKSPHMRRVGDFHALLRFARSAIPEGKWRLFIVYSVKGHHHHHLSSWDPGAHVVQTNVCHSGLLLYRGRGGKWVNFWQIYAAGISSPYPIIAYSVVKKTPSQSLLSKSIFCSPNLLTFCHFLNHESCYFVIPNYQNFLTPKILKMCKPIIVTLLKMQSHYSQSSCENVTLSSWHISISLLLRSTPFHSLGPSFG